MSFAADRITGWTVCRITFGPSCWTCVQGYSVNHMCFHVGLLVLPEKVLVQAAFQAHKGLSGGSAMVVAELALLTMTVLMVLI